MFHRLCLTVLVFLTCSLASPHPSRHHTDLVARNGKGSVVTSPQGLTWYQHDLKCGTAGRNVSEYTCYSGPASNFPSMSSWMNFNAMFKRQRHYALEPIGDTPSEIRDIRRAIVHISRAAKVDPRVILAIVIDESTGNVRVPCTTSFGGVHNCGLMQSYNGTAFDANKPVRSIAKMIRDGTQGTACGPGLVQLFNDAADTNQQTGGNVYAVLRAYNSGTVNVTDLSDGNGATDAYVSNIANYLQGWNGYGDAPSGCSFSHPIPVTTLPTCNASSYTPAPAPVFAGTTANCCTYYTVASGNTCSAIATAYGISLSSFYAWNTEVNSGCTNIIVGYAYCVNSDLTSTPTTTTTTSSTATTSSTTTSSIVTLPTTCVPSSFVPPPSPTETVSGTTPDCCFWYTVQSGDTCSVIETAFDITPAQFLAWNTFINTECTNLWLGYSYCVDSNVAVGSVITTTTTSSRTSTIASSSSTSTTTSSSSTSTTSTTPIPATCVSSAYIPPPTQTVTGTTANCCEWYTVASGDTCGKIETAFSIDMTDFQTWNTYINNDCTNLWLGYSYCVDSSLPIPSQTTSSTTTPTPTTPATCASSAYVPAPTQTVTGTTDQCCEWYTVVTGDTCSLIETAYGIKADDFLAWNTYLNADCTNLWLGYAYCVDSDVVS